MNYTARITRKTILPENEPIFSEMATHIEIEDEAAGEFLLVSQDNGSESHKISISPEEWPLLRDTIEEMIATLREDKP